MYTTTFNLLYNILEKTQYHYPYALIKNDQVNIQLIDEGVVLCEPKRYDKEIILSAGIHGNETAPIELLNILLNEILMEKIIPQCKLLIIFGNPKAMRQQVRETAFNLNRLFLNGPKGNTYEHHRAKKLEHIIQKFFVSSSCTRYHYDFHTSIRGSIQPKFAIYPYHSQYMCRWQDLYLCQLFQLDALVLSNTPTHTFSYYSSERFLAQAFTFELGKVNTFGNNDLEQFNAVIDTLRYLLSYNYLPIQPIGIDSLSVYQVVQVINKKNDTFSLLFDDNIENFTAFKQNTPIAKDDTKTYSILQDDDAILFPNQQVKIGERALLIIRKTNQYDNDHFE